MFIDNEEEKKKKEDHSSEIYILAWGRNTDGELSFGKDFDKVTIPITPKAKALRNKHII